MRSYIFTERERRVIRDLLEGKIGINNPSIQQVRSRIKSFVDLAGDVDLYFRLRGFAESKTA